MGFKLFGQDGRDARSVGAADDSFAKVMLVLPEEVVRRGAAILGEDSGPARAFRLGQELRAKGQEPVYLKDGAMLVVMSSSQAREVGLSLLPGSEPLASTSS
jgi:hypothetical protein